MYNLFGYNSFLRLWYVGLIDKEKFFIFVIYIIKKFIMELFRFFLLIKVFRFNCRIVIFVIDGGGGNIVIILEYGMK